LAGNNYLTREELNVHLGKNKIQADRMRLAYIIMNAELQGLICSGPRKGKQFTYALIEERVPYVKPISKEASLKKLTHLYFNSRGPATVKDYSWWSGLTLTDARSGIEMLGKEFEKVIIEKEEYIFKRVSVPAIKSSQSTFLIPDYDEYAISYKDRSFYHHPKWKLTEVLSNSDFFHAIAVDGYFGGSWNKKLEGKNLVVITNPFSSLTKVQLKNIDQARKRYYKFFS
jgi:hypothetical protein